MFHSLLLNLLQLHLNRVGLAKSAVEALVMLAVDSTSIAWRILEELKPENVQQLVEMLSSDSTELRTMVAKLLGSLRVNSKPEHAHYNRTIDSQLPLVNSHACIFVFSFGVCVQLYIH